MGKTIPVLHAWSVNDSWIAWCKYCRRWHTHGTGEGHRVAHCADQNSPCQQTGYMLQYRGPATDEILKDYRRKLPRGPEDIDSLFSPEGARLLKQFIHALASIRETGYLTAADADEVFKEFLPRFVNCYEEREKRKEVGVIL